MDVEQAKVQQFQGILSAFNEEHGHLLDLTIAHRARVRCITVVHYAKFRCLEEPARKSSSCAMQSGGEDFKRVVINSMRYSYCKPDEASTRDSSGSNGSHYLIPTGMSVTLRDQPRDEMASSACSRRAHDSFTGGTVSSGRSSAVFQHPLRGGLTELNLGRDIQLISPVKYSILPTRLPRPPLFYMPTNELFLPIAALDFFDEDSARFRRSDSENVHVMDEIVLRSHFGPGEFDKTEVIVVATAI
ncbi:hypothetical protein SISNIDRAFT_465728 [Sistotremastrum niveocremeum HHB9708]|uniref:Uncharacterized protein n=1 Tax=Sistotremastrum niveocremeum HHB9708 TaxID=1314777 RepID=A0A164VK36_9AGAM|nr:hypothetical protein SISNIDRAFT_465728 [Sistotremastrum niveocremeum HHB9708]